MSQIVTVCLVIIGNEILSGRTQDANLAHLAKRVNEVGVRLMEVRVIPDVEETIVATIREVSKKFDYVFTTGGIGPTHDDITTAAVAKAFNVKVIRHPEAERILRSHYTPDMVNEARLKMADVPEGAVLLDNPVSSAPGFRIHNVHVMAGVPKIMQAMLDAIIPTLKGGAPVLSLSITTNLPEGTIAAGLTNIQTKYPDIEIGSYPMYQAGGKFSTTLVLRSPNAARNDAAAAEIKALVATEGGKIVVPELV